MLQALGIVLRLTPAQKPSLSISLTLEMAETTLSGSTGAASLNTLIFKGLFLMENRIKGKQEVGLRGQKRTEKQIYLLKFGKSSIRYKIGIGYE